MSATGAMSTAKVLTEAAPPTGDTSIPLPRRERRRSFSRLSVLQWRLIALVAFLLIWHLASIPAGRLLLPSPIDIVPAFVEELRSGQLLTATLASLSVFAAGYVLAIVTGVALGLVMGGLPRVGETLEIYVNAMNATPRVALIPLVILWFGLGPVAKIVVVWLMAVLPVLINTYAGVQNTDPDLVEAARSFGARRWELFRFVVLPAALPYVVTGLRLGAAMAMVGTVFAELYTALAGLGYLMAQFSGSFQTAKYFVPVLTLAVMGMLISEALKIVERRMARWKQTREVSI